MTVAHDAPQMMDSWLAVLQADRSRTRDSQAAAHFYELWKRGNTGVKFTIEVLRTDGPVVLRVAGRLDESTACQLDRECADWMERGARTVVLDFQGIWKVSSEGIRSILVLGKQLQETGGALMLSGVHGNTKRVFQFAGLDRLFPGFDTLADYDLQQSM